MTPPFPVNAHVFPVPFLTPITKSAVNASCVNRNRPHFMIAFSTSSCALRFANGSFIGSGVSGKINTTTVCAFNT
jgi:hypothetical protein